MDKKKRLFVDLIDDDGCVVGHAYPVSYHENDRFRELAWNTNDAVSNYNGTLHFDEMTFNEEEFGVY